MALFDEVSVDKEEVEVGLRECLLDADAVEGGREPGVVGVAYRVAPKACGTVAALGNPDAARAPADMADVGGNCDPDLGAYALIGAQQGQVAVGGGAGDEMDEAGLVEVPERGDDVPVERLEVTEGFGEEAIPKASELCVVQFARLREEGLVFLRSDDLALQVAGKFREEDRVRELFEENRGEIEIAVETDPVALQIAQDAEEWEVGLGGRFVKPFHAMWPGAMVYDVGQMRMQGERKESCGLRGCLRQNENLKADLGESDSPP